MDVFLDIGFTLLGGPKLSPPKRIVEILQLEGSLLEVIRNIVFSEEHLSEKSLINSLENTIGRSISNDEALSILQLWQSQYNDAYPLDGTVDLFAYFGRSQFFRVHIISNLWYPFYKKFRDVLDSSPLLVQTETLSFKEGISKPSPTIFLKALKKANATPTSSIMIGDSFGNDILPCLEIGMLHCIWLNSRPGHEPIPLGLNFPEDSIFEADNLLSVIDTLKEIEKRRS